MAPHEQQQQQQQTRKRKLPERFAEEDYESDYVVDESEYDSGSDTDSAGSLRDFIDDTDTVADEQLDEDYAESESESVSGSGSGSESDSVIISLRVQARSHKHRPLKRIKLCEDDDE